nr:PREDICTED: synaptoporin-like isoform X2 [Bemisia tabaci]
MLQTRLKILQASGCTYSFIICTSFSVFAYAAIRGYEGFVDINYCKDMSAHLVFDYPFALSDVKYKLEKPCVSSKDTTFIDLAGDFSLESELFVVSCWMSFLYCIIIIYIYVKLTPHYESNVKWPIYDFLASLIVSGLWIFHFVIWARAVSGIKEATDPDRVVEECKIELHCLRATTSPYFGLNLSIALGLINVILWTSNQWFLFKETPWFGQGTAVSMRGGPALHI